MSMKWRSRCFNMSEQHRWKAKFSNKIFVANRRPVHFEYPGNWIIVPEGGFICIYDGKEPDNNIRLQVSVTQICPAGSIVNWSKLPSLESQMEHSVIGDDRRHRTRRGPTLKARRRDLEYVWLEIDFIDPTERRKAHSRACLARGRNVQTLITMEFWPEDHDFANNVWNDMLQSLKLGEYVENPFRGPMSNRQGAE